MAFQEDINPLNKFNTNSAYYRSTVTAGYGSYPITTSMSVGDTINLFQCNSTGLITRFKYCTSGVITAGSKFDLGFYLLDGTLVVADALGTLDLTAASLVGTYNDTIIPSLVVANKIDMHFRDIPAVKSQLQTLNAYSETFLVVALTVKIKPTAGGVLYINASWAEGKY